MFSRSAAGHLKELSRQFPSVTIVGPRQSGKTTLAQSVFPRYAYASLEDPDVRRHAVDEPFAEITVIRRQPKHDIARLQESQALFH